MHSGSLKPNPVGDRIRGTNLYYNSSTGVADWRNCERCLLSIGRRRTCVRRDGSRQYFGRQTNTGGISEGRTCDYGRRIKLLFIGEAPGETENATGIPFSGISGRILNQILEYVTDTFEYCITNTICCQPKNLVSIVDVAADSEDSPSLNLSRDPNNYEFKDFNRKPNAIEINACHNHLVELEKTFKPTGIVYLGMVARNSYMTNKPTLELVHPASIARKEFKVLPMKKQARELSLFIESLRRT